MIFLGVPWLEFGDGRDNTLAKGFEGHYLVYVGHVEDEVLDTYGA
jgi:hypothetical protein